MTLAEAKAELAAAGRAIEVAERLHLLDSDAASAEAGAALEAIPLASPAGSGLRGKWPA